MSCVIWKWSGSRSVVSYSLQSHGLYSPWTSPARILEWVAFPSPGELPNPGIEPRSPALQADSLPAEPQGKPNIFWPLISNLHEIIVSNQCFTIKLLFWPIKNKTKLHYGDISRSINLATSHLYVIYQTERKKIVHPNFYLFKRDLIQ